MIGIPCRVAHIVVAAVVLSSPRALIAWQCPDGSPPPCGRAVRAAAPSANSVAVLTFDNLGRDTADAYIAEGLTEEVTARLGQVNRLTVTSRTTVRRLRNAAEMQTAALGRAFGAAYLVSGSVRRAGDRLRVTVELVRATSGTRVWGDQYDRGMADLLGIQEEIARNVATGIAGRLLPGERRAIAARPTNSAEAYDHYLRANRLLREVSPAMLPRVIAEADAALQSDPGFAGALAVQAVAYVLANNWGYTSAELPAETVLARARTASAAALRADSMSSDAWAAAGATACLVHPRNCDGAAEAFERAIALNPSNPLARQWRHTFLRRMGRFDEADAEAHRTLALDPGLAQVVADLGFVRSQWRQYAQARVWYDSAVAMDPSAWQLPFFRSRVLIELGDSAGALADADAAVRLAGGGATLAHEGRVQILARTGDTVRAVEELAPLLRRFAGADSVNVRDGYELSLALLALGRRDDALAMLDRTRPRGMWLWSYLWLPGFDAVRRDPRFVRIYNESKPPGAPDPPER